MSLHFICILRHFSIYVLGVCLVKTKHIYLHFYFIFDTLAFALIFISTSDLTQLQPSIQIGPGMLLQVMDLQLLSV